MEDAKHRLDHRRLDSIANMRTGSWKETERRISAERLRQRDDNRKAWFSYCRLDLCEIGLGDTRSHRDLTLAEAGVLSRRAVGLADVAKQREGASLSFLLQPCCPRRGHVRIELARAYLRLRGISGDPCRR